MTLTGGFDLTLQISDGALTRACAARELAVVVRYGFRDLGRRAAYLERLRTAGALPLRLVGDDAEEARRILRETGLPWEDVDRVVQRPAGPAR